MGFLEFLVVASMPPLQVLIVAGLGAFLATDRCKILTTDARKNLNKVVFYVFTPSLVFGTLAKTITLNEIISWWFMPVNIGIIFLCGTILGRIVVKILRPPRHLEGLIVASCLAGNLGNLMIIIVPAICGEEGNPFGLSSVCKTQGTAYASFSMALGNFYVWTHTYNLMKEASEQYKKIASGEEGSSKVPNKRSDVDHTTHLLHNVEDEEASKNSSTDDAVIQCSLENKDGTKLNWWGKIVAVVHQLVEELLAPPSCSAMAGFVVGSIPWLKGLIIGSSAPLRVIEESLQLLGGGTIPSVTLILGGNLTKGMRHSGVRSSMLVAIIIVRYVLLPIIGVFVVRGAAKLGLLPVDLLFQYALMSQFTLPPAMNLGTMAELFNVGQEECSVIFLWTYVVAAIALTVWSTVYLWILAVAV